MMANIQAQSEHLPRIAIQQPAHSMAAEGRSTPSVYIGIMKETLDALR
jgi:hypothetical protein